MSILYALGVTQTHTLSTQALSRADWITAALDALYEEGEAGIKILTLTRLLGVTKGSFYWHFKDITELKSTALSAWRESQLAILQKLIRTEHPDPASRVRALIDFTVSKDSRHDIGVRAWALVNEDVRAAVEEIDLARLRYLEKSFRALGHAADEAAQRARILYYYQVGEYSVAIKDPPGRRKRHAQARADWLISGAGE